MPICADRIEPLVEPAHGVRRGDLADLVTTEHPEVGLSKMTLAPATRAHLGRVLREQRQRALIESHGFAPQQRLLLTGPPGTGKSMTASALAAELSLPLATIHLDALTSKYAGEIPVKLRVVYDAMTHPQTVYLFDGLDAIEARQETWHDTGEARRILNMFLSFLDETQPESLIVAVGDRPSLLDDALLRRFDAVIAYYLPDSVQALDLLRQYLRGLNTSAISWTEVGDHVKGLSHAGLVRAAKSAAKRAILHDKDSVSTADLITSLGELRKIHHHVMGFGTSKN